MVNKINGDLCISVLRNYGKYPINLTANDLKKGVMATYHIIAVILSIAAICSGHDSTCNRYGSIKGFGNLVWNKRLRSTYLQFHPTTLKQCAIECLVRRGKCKSINFSRQMSFCELNYNRLSDNQTADNCTSFDYSDISTWSKDMAGKCKHKVCNKKERCSPETGNCSLSDCGPVNFDIPKNSVIQNHGHHEIGNAVDFLCKKGYRMYNKTTLESMYVAIIKCKTSGEWEKVEFGCLACDRKTLHVAKLVELVENTTSLVNEEYALQCKSGYRPYINGTTKSDSVTVRCNIQTHKWERPDFLCKKCNPIGFQIPKNSVLQNYSHHYTGNSLNFTCEDGYLMYNKTTLENMSQATMTCDNSGHWGDVEFVCLACDRKTLHVEKLVELVENTTSLVNEEYALQCKSGYRPYINGTTKSDSVTVRCNIQTHKWERPDFLCKKCDPIGFQIPKNSVLQNYSHHYTGNSLNFTCEDGYLMYNKTTLENMSEATMTCNAAGHWVDVEFVCLECDLITLKIPNNSVYVISSDVEQDEDFFTFVCDDNYLMYNKTTSERIDFEITKCNAFGQWEDVESICLSCDRKNLKVDQFAELVNINSINNYTFRCKSGYTAYVNGKHTSNVFNVKCNEKTQEWEGQDFFCKNLWTLSKDFCRNGYYYYMGVCLKYHSEKLTHQRAQEVCMNENAHLLVVTNTISTHRVSIQAKFFPSETVFIDGMTTNGQLQGWANQTLQYYISSSSNDQCAVIDMESGMTLKSCLSEKAFVCQFEVCPKTAGYRYNGFDICLNYNEPSPYSKDLCKASTIPYKARTLPMKTVAQKRIYMFLPYRLHTSAKSQWAWYTGEDLAGNPYAVDLQELRITTVDKGKVLPFVCEIDTISVIIDLNLNATKPVFP